MHKVRFTEFTTVTLIDPILTPVEVTNYLFSLIHYGYLIRLISLIIGMDCDNQILK